MHLATHHKYTSIDNHVLTLTCTCIQPHICICTQSSGLLLLAMESNDFDEIGMKSKLLQRRILVARKKYDKRWEKKQAGDTGDDDSDDSGSDFSETSGDVPIAKLPCVRMSVFLCLCVSVRHKSFANIHSCDDTQTEMLEEEAGSEIQSESDAESESLNDEGGTKPCIYPVTYSTPLRDQLQP